MKSGVLIGVAALGVVGLLYYMSKKSTVGATPAGVPINGLPARAYALNNSSNPQGQPPPVTFTQAAGVAVAEGLLGALNGAVASNYGSSSDATVGSSDSYDSGSGGSGSGGSGFDVGF